MLSKIWDIIIGPIKKFVDPLYQYFKENYWLFSTNSTNKNKKEQVYKKVWASFMAFFQGFFTILIKNRLHKRLLVKRI